MHVFKTQGIVIRVGKVSEKELWYKIFFREYGILLVQKPKKTREKPIDIGYHISCEILTQKDKKVSTIGNIKVLHYFETQGKSYNEIESFLKLISLLQKEIPSGVPNGEIYAILAHICEISSPTKTLLAHLKTLSCIGILPENHENITVQKILRFVHTHHYNDIIRLKEIPEDIQKKLEQML